jgi:uncharacterized integral membrane protein
MAHISSALFLQFPVSRILLLIFQEDPVDPNSIAYEFGRAFGTVFIVLFVAAFIFGIVKKSRKK